MLTRSQTETFQSSDDTVDQSVHGYNGDFQISHGGLFPNETFTTDFLGALRAAGWDESPDLEDLRAVNVFGVYKNTFQLPSMNLTSLVATCLH